MQRSQIQPAADSQFSAANVVHAANSSKRDIAVIACEMNAQAKTAPNKAQ